MKQNRDPSQKGTKPQPQKPPNFDTSLKYALSPFINRFKIEIYQPYQNDNGAYRLVNPQLPHQHIYVPAAFITAQMQTPILDSYSDQVQKNYINYLNYINQTQKTITALRVKKGSQQKIFEPKNQGGRKLLASRLSVNFRPFIFLTLYSFISNCDLATATLQSMLLQLESSITDKYICQTKFEKMNLMLYFKKKSSCDFGRNVSQLYK